MRHWTIEERRRQSKLIKQWKPWRLAGVKTPEGKEKSKMNAYKHGGRCADIRKMQRVFTEWKSKLSQIKNLFD